MKLATPPAKYDSSDQAQMRGTLEREDANNLKKGSSVPFILMSKPDGTVGRLTINGAGVPIWTALP
jgi:hypothetical protein